MIYAFDEYELDTRLYELRRAGAPLQLEPKVFDLLAYLVEHGDRIRRRVHRVTLRPGELGMPTTVLLRNPRPTTLSKAVIGFVPTFVNDHAETGALRHKLGPRDGA